MKEQHNEETQLNALYQEIIFEHYRAPHNKGVIEGAQINLKENNPLCGDEITVTAKVENGVLKDIKVNPKGCSISVASSSMMTDVMRGKSLKEAVRWIDEVTKLMRSEHTISDDDLGELESLKGVAQFPVRIKCALLAWMTLLKGIQEEVKKGDS